MAEPSKVIELRKLLSERFPQAHAFRPAEEESFVTGVATIDQVGLPKGAISELVSPEPSGGSAMLLANLVRSATANGHFIALIDGRDSFDPQSLGPLDCQRLLWVRCRNADETVKAADLVLRDGNLPFVVVDLRLNLQRELRRLNNQVWFRLQTLVNKTAATCLILTPSALVSSARVRLTLKEPLPLAALEERQRDLLQSVHLYMTRKRKGVLDTPAADSDRSRNVG